MRTKSFLTLSLIAPFLFSCLPYVDVPNDDFHTGTQYRYQIDSDWRNIHSYARGAEELSFPRALSLPLSLKGDQKQAKSFCVQLCTGEIDFSDKPILKANSTSYELYNAELGTNYFYRAAPTEEELDSARVVSFKVANQAPRNLLVDGMVNFRDVGGWESSLVPGARIRQGLYFRCANPDAITEKGKETIKELGIKVDIDMRDSYAVPELSAASTEEHPVELVPASIPSNTEAYRYEEFEDVYQLIFERIAEVDENPIMLHCAQGADRTGIVTFFLLALCGVSIEDCGRDYCWTNFSAQGKRDPSSEFDHWVEKTESIYSRESSFADKMKAHLMTKGISEDTLETIRELFVPGYRR